MRVHLTKDKVALIDHADLPLIRGYRWSAFLSRNTWYAKAGTKTLMHRLILGLTHSRHNPVDHINGDGLDNRRRNLRVSDNSRNTQRAFIKRPSRHYYLGAYLQKSGRWEAKITYRNYTWSIGRFDSAREAAEAYDALALQLYGPDAMTNKRMGTIQEAR